MSIEATKIGFEQSFAEEKFYNKQTQDEKHLQDILTMLDIKPGMRILDLGCGSGYLTFPIAANKNCEVVGLDIVTNTLIQNAKKAEDKQMNNISFVCYEGFLFPFENESFDLVVTRYALHHFPMIETTLKEVSRILKPKGKFFISDPRPNDCDQERFVDAYMQLKKDGHIKFYTKEEWNNLCKRNEMELIDSFNSQIRFPKLKSTVEGYEEVLKKYNPEIIKSYQLEETEKELWITEQVNNLLFEKI